MPHRLASRPPRADCHRGRVRRHHANRAPSPLHERFDIANAPPSRTPQRGRAACEPAQTSRNVGHAHHVTVTCMNHRLRVAAVPAVRLNDSAGASTRTSTRTSTASALVRCRRVWSVRRALVRARVTRAERRRRRRQQRHDRRSQRPRRRTDCGISCAGNYEHVRRGGIASHTLRHRDVVARVALEQHRDPITASSHSSVDHAPSATSPRLRESTL